jgi:hypothetical protein
VSGIAPGHSDDRRAPMSLAISAKGDRALIPARATARTDLPRLPGQSDHQRCRPSFSRPPPRANSSTRRVNLSSRRSIRRAITFIDPASGQVAPS